MFILIIDYLDKIDMMKQKEEIKSEREFYAMGLLGK
jgi:hypothetical protein